MNRFTGKKELESISSFFFVNSRRNEFYFLRKMS